MDAEIKGKLPHYHPKHLIASTNKSQRSDGEALKPGRSWHELGKREVVQAIEIEMIHLLGLLTETLAVD